MGCEDREYRSSEREFKRAYVSGGPVPGRPQDTSCQIFSADDDRDTVLRRLLGQHQNQLGNWVTLRDELGAIADRLYGSIPNTPDKGAEAQPSYGGLIGELESILIRCNIVQGQIALIRNRLSEL